MKKRIILDTTGTIAENSSLVIGELIDSEARFKPRFTPVSDELSDRGFGNFTVNHDGVWLFDLNNGHPDVNRLAEGDSLTDSFEFSYLDRKGNIHYKSIDLTITGSNDAPVASAAVAHVDEPINADDVAFAAGKVEAIDLDSNAAVKFYDTSLPQYGTITMAEDGNWTYVVDSGSELVHGLNEGDTLTEEIDFVALDEHGAESTSTLTIVIHGTNDDPVAQEVFTSIAEPINTDDLAIASGKVEAHDPDFDAVVKFYDVTRPQYGTIIMAEDGNWDYTVDSGSPVVQALNEGDFLIEAIDYVAIDEHGAEHRSSINLTITGTNDAPVAEEAFGTIAEGTPLVIGELVASDIDEGSSLTFTPVSDVLSDSGYGNFTVNHDGVWLYDLHSDHPEVNALAVGDTLEDTFEYIVTDEHGASTYGEINVLITGTNDAPVAAPGFASISEGTPLVIGELEAYDVDAGSSISYTPVSDVPSASGFGNFTVNHDGVWLYDLHSDHPAVAALGEGDTLQDQFEYTVTDEHGASSVGSLLVTITGTSDAPLVDQSLSSSTIADSIETEAAAAPLEIVANDGSTVNLDAPVGQLEAAPGDGGGKSAGGIEETIAPPLPPIAIEDDAIAAAGAGVI